MAKEGLTIKKSFCMGNSRILGLHDVSTLDISFVSPKKILAVSAEVRETLVKALRTGVGAE